MAKLPSVVPYEMADAAGQPTSMTSNDNPKFLTIAWAAGPKLSVNKPRIKFKPVNPIPIINADLKALPSLIRNTIPKINSNNGKNTVGPASNSHLITPIVFPLYSIPTLFNASIISSVFLADSNCRMLALS